MLLNYFAYISLGLLAGILAGLFGIGGGIVIVPALILFFRFSPALANGTSLMALLAPVGILGVIQYYRAKLIDLRAALTIALGILSAVAFGAFAAVNLPSKTLKIIYGFFLLIVSNNFLKITSLLKKSSNSENNLKEDLTKNRQISFLPAYFIGILAGILAGFFGIGGGIVIVPILTYIFKYPYKMAVGTSLTALLLPVGLPGVLVYYKNGCLDLNAALIIACGLIIGAYLGSKINIKLPSKLVRKLYGLFLIIVALDFIFSK